MPPLTRSAARAAKGDVEALALRASVARKRDAVWEHRTTDRVHWPRPQGDTALARWTTAWRCSLASTRSCARTRGVGRRVPSTMATAQAHEQLRDALNAVANLNVTTRTINVWKTGPITGRAATGSTPIRCAT